MKLIGKVILAILLLIPQIASGNCVQGDCINGNGTAVLPDGSRYVGEFRDGVRTGRGSMTYPDGTKYVGDWLNDKFHGSGTLVSIDRFKYSGEFVNGVRQGQGIMETEDGKIYEGQWLNGVPHGQGKFIDPGREEFVGQFENGQRNGPGEAIYPDGTKYKGQWADDLPNGQGVKTLADGMQYLGEFKNGLMYGSGTMIMPGGSKVKIQWQNDSPVKEEKTEPGAPVSGIEEKNEWYRIPSLSEAETLHLQKSLDSGVHTEEFLQESAAGPEPVPPQEAGVAAGTAEPASPQEPEVAVVITEQARPEETGVAAGTAEQAPSHSPAIKEFIIKDQAHVEADTKIQPMETEKIAPEAVMPVAGEAESGLAKGYGLYAESKNGVKYARIAKGANIRSGPSLTSEVLRTVPPGYPVIVLEHQEEWYLVEDFRERKGWVFASLLTGPETVIVKVNKANLRSGPGLTDDVIMQLDYGTIVSVVESRGDWLQVSGPGDFAGWLHREVIWP